MEIDEPGTSNSQLLAAISSLSQSIASSGLTGRRAEGEGGNRRRAQSKGPRRSPPPVRGNTTNPLAEQSAEQRGRLFDQKRCFYCASQDHAQRDCPVAAAGKPPTPAALGK
jgi:hypothetical protein